MIRLRISLSLHTTRHRPSQIPAYIESMSNEYRLLRIDRRRFELRGSDASVAATIDFVGCNRAMIETRKEHFLLLRSGFLTPSLILRDDAANGCLIAPGTCSGGYRLLDSGLS